LKSKHGLQGLIPLRVAKKPIKHYNIMKIVILNYVISAVEVICITDLYAEKIRQNEDNFVEDYLQNVLDYNLSEISYMIVDEEQVPVYYDDDSTMPTMCERDNADEPAVLL
jgi:hypothetical protein